MQVLTREKFLALEGSVLFAEVELVDMGDTTKWRPKPHTDPLMIRDGHSISGSYYESAIAFTSLLNLFTYCENDVWKSFVEELDLTPCRGSHDNQYYLVYSHEDIKAIISKLLECL